MLAAGGVRADALRFSSWYNGASKKIPLENPVKRFLLPHLICPACLPREEPLTLSAVDREEGDDIVAGRLSCRRCRRRFDIADGIARLLPDTDGGPSGSQWRYEEAGMADRYLWSHYADLAGVEGNASANHAWQALLQPVSGPALDAGCAVGRLTFQLAAVSSWAVGCDLSLGFIRTARRLAREGKMTFSLPLEGNLRQEFSIILPGSWRRDNVEFVVADAQRLPFARGSFRQMVSLNLIDRVPYPLAHLYEVNRVSTQEEARLLCASPFSWSSGTTPEERWLGGRSDGDYSGRGIDNLRELLQGKNGVISPPWRVAAEGAVEWLMRSHCNHREIINSLYLAAER